MFLFVSLVVEGDGEEDVCVIPLDIPVPAECDTLAMRPDQHDKDNCKDKNCLPCLWLRLMPRWMRETASLSPDGKKCVQWLMECPVRFNAKKNGYGCSVCYTQNVKSRWARFEVRPVNKEQVNQQTTRNHTRLHCQDIGRLHWLKSLALLLAGLVSLWISEREGLR